MLVNTAWVLLLVSVSATVVDTTPDFGNVTFQTSCVTVQDDFNAAVAVLHSFWYQKARELFYDILQKDPNCGIAYWGIAMSYWHPLW